MTPDIEYLNRLTYSDPKLVRLALALELDAEPIDDTNDPFIERYLTGHGLTRVQLTQLSRIRFPALGALASADLAALLRSSESLQFMRRTWNDICYSRQLEAVDAHQAAEELQERIARDFASAVTQFEKSLRLLPSRAELAGTTMSVSAALLAGNATGDPKVWTGVAAAGAGGVLAATFINRHRTKRRNKPALRLLRQFGTAP